MFYFEQLLNEGLAGIERTAILSTIIGIAYTLLLIGFLVGLYQSAMRGGDLQALGVTAIKYVVIAVILANWSPVFHEVNASFNSVADFIGNSSGAGDMFMSWMDQLREQFQANGSISLLPLVAGGAAALITALLVLVAYVLYAIAIVVFGFFYTLYGCVLYALGPLVLALLPIAGVGQLAKTYATNVMVWNAWGILYALFGALITAVNANRINDLTDFMGFFTGNLDSTMLGLISIIYALSMMLIPFIAKRIIAGDVGATAYSVVRAGMVAAGAAVAAVAGFAAGAGAGAPVGAAAGAGASASATSGGAAAASSSTAPRVLDVGDMIRSGVMHAMSGGAPAAPAATSSSAKPASAGASSGTEATRAQRSTTTATPMYRPVGVGQTIAFHAARFAGNAMADAAQNGNRQESRA
jgi:hypothetical protein